MATNHIIEEEAQAAHLREYFARQAERDFTAFDAEAAAVAADMRRLAGERRARERIEDRED